MFVVAGGFAGLSGALYGIFTRGVFPDYVFWPQSAQVMIMTILGGMNFFWGPPVGALVLVWLNQEITNYTAVLAVRARHHPADPAVRPAGRRAGRAGAAVGALQRRRRRDEPHAARRDA